MSEPVADYLIVGGGVAGGHAVYGIRKHDKTGSIIVINKEDHFPYDRPPLSKEYLAGKMKRPEVFFRADSYYKRNKIDFIRGHTVHAIDTFHRRVTLDDGRELSYKSLLIVTGGRVRRLELPGSDLEGIYYLRTIEDCDIIRKAVAKSKKAVIVGGGFIGCEVAATLRDKGLKVTLIHKSSQLLSAAIDEETAHWVKGYHSRKGVNVLLNANIARFVGKDGRVKAVELDNGKRIPAHFVVAGIGITPNTELAEKAGLKIDRGVLVNEYLETSADGVYAAGDIARFYSPIFKRNLRVEHVDVAQKQGETAGMNMTGKKKPFDELPYFFSYQFDLEVNAYGDLSQHTEIVRRGKLDASKGFIQFYFDGGILNGVLSVNADWKEIELAKTILGMRKEYPNPSILSDESKTLASTIKNIKKDL
jgi:3-phenylpropionate/trans-cinnamate dioxygenase ferredoxin reductase subunit